MQARQWMVRWAMGVILLASSACAPSVKGLLHDPGFDYDTIVANQLAVGGVTSALYPLSETESSRYSDLLLRQFREYRGVFRYLPAGYVANRFGPDRYHRMLHDYGTSGEIGDLDFQVFHEELSDDLATGSAVWGGVMEESGRRRNRHIKVQMLIEAVVEEILMGKKEEDLYPEPTSLPEMLETIFSGFARNMPGKGFMENLPSFPTH